MPSSPLPDSRPCGAAREGPQALSKGPVGAISPQKPARRGVYGDEFPRSKSAGSGCRNFRYEIRLLNRWPKLDWCHEIGAGIPWGCDWGLINGKSYKCTVKRDAVIIRLARRSRATCRYHAIRA